MSSDVAAALAVLADAVADRVIERLRGTPDGSWCDQHQSPMGPKRHAAAVRRRIASAQGGAAIVGRRYLLDQQALSDELTKIGSKSTTSTAAAAPPTAAQQLERRLGLVGGGK